MAEPRYRWNQTAGRYVDGRGRFVSREAVTNAMYDAADNAGKRMATASKKLRDGKLTIQQWQLQMRAEIKTVHLFSGAGAKGGWAQLSQADFGRIGQRIREQYRFLDRMATQIANGTQKLNGTFIRRSELYGNAGRQTFMLVERADKESRGMTEERCLLRGSQHCAECPGEAAKGWVPIGTLVPVGGRICNQNCRCIFEYR